MRRAIVLITAVYACQFFVAGGIFFWLIEYLELVGAKVSVGTRNAFHQETSVPAGVSCHCLCRDIIFIRSASKGHPN